MHKHKAPRAAIAALAFLPVLTAAPAWADNSLQTVLTGLDNPYGLTFGSNGALYVAEAGNGGSTAAFTNGNGVATNFGDTGAVAMLLHGQVSTVITGLPSLAPASGVEATGLQGLTFSGGTLYGIFGLGAMPSQLASFDSAGQPGAGTNASDLGQLVSLTPGSSTITPLDNVAAYDTQANYSKNNPDGTVIEANPYGLTALQGGGFAVTDGGGNVVLNAQTNDSTPTLITSLPPVANPEFNGGHGLGGPTYQSVPTAITKGPDGNLYVGQYTGFPFITGAASVFQINPTTGAATPFVTGLTGITGLAFAPNGDLYIVDKTSSLIGPPSEGQLIQYDPTTGKQIVLDTLGTGSVPTGIAVAPDNSVYISTLGAGANAGQVLRFSQTAVPEASPLAMLALSLPMVGLVAFKARKRKS